MSCSDAIIVSSFRPALCCCLVQLPFSSRFSPFYLCFVSIFFISSISSISAISSILSIYPIYPISSIYIVSIYILCHLFMPPPSGPTVGRLGQHWEAGTQRDFGRPRGYQTFLSANDLTTLSLPTDWVLSGAAKGCPGAPLVSSCGTHLALLGGWVGPGIPSLSGYRL